QTLGTNNLFHFLALYVAHGPTMPIFVWMASPPVTAAASEAGIPLPEPTSPFGPLLLLAVLLGGLWIARAPAVRKQSESASTP
ncbi:MAG TPA: hypothetical protein VK762_24835, partial [Polyangiaceae bacterium]|nr:hypothetical protein [Polyangiaceae bacterium]